MALVRLVRSLCISPNQQRSISHSVGVKLAEGKPSADVPSTSTSKEAGQQELAKEDWTEVVDEKTSGTYYWNQSTGETTNVGEGKPLGRFRDPEYEEYYKQQRQGADPQDIFAPSWKEPREPDRTMYYIFLGGVIGVFAGWTARFTH